MIIKIITKPITRDEATKIGKEFYDEMVKGVVDVKEEIIALGGEYHMDANNVILENGSSQENVWGFNIYPSRKDDQWIEYTALVNIRPASKNMNMTVEDEKICAKMKKIIEKLIV